MKECILRNYIQLFSILYCSSSLFHSLPVFYNVGKSLARLRPFESFLGALGLIQAAFYGISISWRRETTFTFVSLEHHRLEMLWELIAKVPRRKKLFRRILEAGVVEKLTSA